MAMNISGLESYFPTPGVVHADIVIDATVRTLGTLNTKTRLVIASPSRAMLITFDGSAPVQDGHGILYGAGSTLIVNEATAAAVKLILAYSDDTDGALTVQEMQRT